MMMETLTLGCDQGSRGAGREGGRGTGTGEGRRRGARGARGRADYEWYAVTYDAGNKPRRCAISPCQQINNLVSSSAEQCLIHFILLAEIVLLSCPNMGR